MQKGKHNIIIFTTCRSSKLFKSMSLKKVAISQSNYIPWKGYFDNINLVDEFILYDDMQYTKRDWRNRNKVKAPQGLKWLSVPVEVKGKFFQKINETKVSDPNWNVSHFDALKNYYLKAKCYKTVLPFIEDLYLNAKQETISKINHYMLQKVCDFLEIKTKITTSSDYNLLEEGKTERLVDICVQAESKHYYSSPAAKVYMDEQLFKDKGISVNYFDYSGYKEYEQLHGDFEHGVSILDLIFNEGENAKNFLKST